MNIGLETRVTGARESAVHRSYRGATRQDSLIAHFSKDRWPLKKKKKIRMVNTRSRLRSPAPLCSTNAKITLMRAHRAVHDQI